jgi:CsoR family transcriptional regulator, copper-sensing transcriptional repressor
MRFLTIYLVGVYGIIGNKRLEANMNHSHPDHSAQIKRLNRIEGQIGGIRQMITNRRYCPEILAQTKAVCSAIRSLEGEILRHHMEHCVRDAISSADGHAVDRKIEEMIKLFKRD